jgi:hypothetical protein
VKNINIKISRDFVLITGLIALIFIPYNEVNAQLNDEVRKNFSKRTAELCFNSINYSVDDIDGFELVETGKGDDLEQKWECSSGKCQEYKTTINCLFDDAFEQTVNKTNAEIKEYTNDKYKNLKDTKLSKGKDCSILTLTNIQEQQEALKFKTSCEGKELSKPYSACRVTETILNELCGYNNFLEAKAQDYLSFSNENEKITRSSTKSMSEFKAKKKLYRREIEKTQKSFLSTVYLYKNFIHNYQKHAWLVAIKTKLETPRRFWQKIRRAIETFPAKFKDASSTE